MPTAPEADRLEPFALERTLDQGTSGEHRRLPQAKVELRYAFGPRPSAGQLFKESLAAARTLRLPLSDPQLRELAAIMTLVRLLHRATWEFYRARNRANDLLAAIRTLFVTPWPWPEAAREAVLEALAALADDPVLTVARPADHVVAAASPLYPPHRRENAQILAAVRAPDAATRGLLQRFSRDFEWRAAGTVGNSTSIFVDIDGVGSFILPGKRDVRADEVIRWAAWEVAAYLEHARGHRRNIGPNTEKVLAKLGPELVGRYEALDAVGLRHRGWRAYFGGPRRNSPSEHTVDYAASPLAVWCSDAGSLAARLERAV